MPAPPAIATLSRVHARGEGGVALRDVSLAVLPQHILTLLGPPGAGKTTLLRLLAGYVRPDSGQVLVGGRGAAGIPPGRRGLALVEHGLGSFARLSAAEAIGFAARPGARVAELLQQAGLAEVAGLRPHALRAGQRAVLAIARACAAASSALLLDEPAAGLEACERDAVHDMVRAARARGMGVVYATSDPAQAVALGDRMAVLCDGGIRQEGAPQTVYDDPTDAAVAALTGPVAMLPGMVEAEDDDGVLVRLDAGPLVGAREAGVASGGRCTVCIRPERLAISAVPAEQIGDGALPALVEWLTYHGDHLRLGLRAGGTAFVAARPAGAPLRGLAPGQTVSVAWQPHHASAFRPFAEKP